MNVIGHGGEQIRLTVLVRHCQPRIGILEHQNSSNNTFEYCTIEGSDWGLKFYGTPSTTSGNVVKNCTLKKNDQAIRAENTELDVYDCTIEDNRHAFVLINNTSSTGGIYLDDNTVRNNDRDGIYSWNSVVDILTVWAISAPTTASMPALPVTSL